MNITIDDLLRYINLYNPDKIGVIKKVYDYEDYLHDGQKRQSVEPYIIHPLNVVYILTQIQADADTIHDVLLHGMLENCKEKNKRILCEIRRYNYGL